MKKKGIKRKLHQRTVSWCLVTSMVVTATSANIAFTGAQKAQAALAQKTDITYELNTDRALADSLPAREPSAKELKQLETITMKEGNSSINGLQSVTFVDQDGKVVDREKEIELTSGVTSEEIAEMTGEWNNVGASSVDNQSSMGTIRNQGSYGLCWAFSSVAALEGNILTKNKNCTAVINTPEKLDLSERHMAWFAHNTYSTLSSDPTKKTDGVKKTTPNAAYTGGYYRQALAYLTRGSGMALEEDCPYNGVSMDKVPEGDRYDSVVTIHDSYEVTYDKKNIDSTITAVKSLIDNYGAVGVSYNDVPDGYSGNSAPKGMAFYQTAIGSNHAVCIVGYDDNFAVDNFTGKAGKPAKPGAWLVRNSWGSAWGNKGYFWISYYDGSLCDCFAYNAINSSEYGDIYQYDAIGVGANATKTRGAANVFQARKNDTLKSVGIYFVGALAKGTIEIYVNNKKMANPADGELVHTENISPITYAGYHIIDLSKRIDLKKKQYFSIVLTLGNGSDDYYGFEGKLADTKSSAKQTYYIPSSGMSPKMEWLDANKQIGNACIKALMTSETDNTYELDELIKAASEITLDSVAAWGGESLYDWIQKELTAAKAAQKTKAADDVTRAIKRLKQAAFHTASTNMYTDSAKTMGTGIGGVNMYVSGGKFKKNGVTTAYGARTFIFAVNKLKSWKNAQKKVAAYNGKYVAVVTSTNKKPSLDENGNPLGPDTKAQAVVKTKISGSKVTITPLQEGEAYVWILYYPKLGRSNLSEIENYAVTKVSVGPQAPSVVKLYDTAQKAADCTDTTIIQYKGTVIPQGGSTSVYVAGTVGKRTKKVDTLAPTKLDGTHYEPIVPAKYQDYITVSRDASQSNKFTIKIADNILDAFKVKVNKKLAVTIPFYCNKNGKKLGFKVTIGNPVKSISLAKAEGESNLSLLENDGITEITIKQPEDGKAVTGNIVETKQLYHDDRTCTDGNAVLRMAEADDIIYNASNVAKVSTTLNAAQKKITMALQKDKMTYKISVAKGTPVGTSVYFVINHNAYEHRSGAGYKIVKVTVV